MISWTTSRVADALGTTSNVSRIFDSVCTDTRAIQPNSLFVALIGERFDGHDYLGEAKHKGATGAVVRRGTPSVEGLVLFEVEDTVGALGLLARARRRQIAGPVVAVTGTNGKTSTKEMFARALGTQWHVHHTKENLNNLIGVPLTVLDAPEDCDALVVEVGASELGEVGRLRTIVEPSVGVVTNVSSAHLDGFGSLAGVLAEKCSLLDNVPLAVVGTDPPELSASAVRAAERTVSAGLSELADVYPDSWSIDDGGVGHLECEGVSFTLPLVGKHQLENLMIVLATAKELQLDLGSVAKALEAVRLPSGRCEVLTDGNRVVIKDSYNANPSSLRAALQTAEVMRGNREFVVVLGTMLELGDESAELHAEMAEAVMRTGPSVVGVMGEFEKAFERFARDLGDRLVTAPESDTLGRRVAARLTGNELILVKGSRGVRLERAIPHLLSTEETTCSTTS